MKKKYKTRIRILRKIPYQGSSIIVNSFSPEVGRLDFLIRGAKRISGKHFITIDLFRELSVEYTHNSSYENTLHSLSHSSVIKYYDELALYPDLMLKASEICLFIIRNLKYNIPCPLLYNTFGAMLECFKHGKYTEVCWEKIIKTVFLYENGLLIYDDHNDIFPTKTLKILFEYLADNYHTGQLIEYKPESTWHQTYHTFSDTEIRKILEKVIKFHEMQSSRHI